MFKNALIGFIFVSSLVIAIDWYAWQGVRLLTSDWSLRSKSILKWIYWSWTAAGFLFFLLFRMDLVHIPPAVLRIVSSIIFMVFFGKLFWCIFLLADDVLRIFRWIWSMIAVKPSEMAGEQTEGISRLKFLSWVGMGVGAAFVGGSMWGIARGAHNYTVRRRELPIKGLPKAFDGLKILQLTDIHSGSFWSREAVQRGVDMAIAEKPDLFIFTGDLVNDLATEVEPYMEMFAKIKAPLGAYSILGNHDYADYVVWDDFNAEQAKFQRKQMGFYRTPKQQANLEKLIGYHKEMGWDILMNENRVIEKDGEKLAIVGVENWSNKARFPKYGDLKKALKGLDENLPKLLLSHDPSHWREQVLNKHSSVKATFSGHTHGFQFGVDSKFYRWSPVKFVYKEWIDLYTENEQHLYVNRGFGYLGYPGRLGIFPEIGVFTLKAV